MKYEAQGLDEAADEIWADDLLRRRHEADLLTGYIESVFTRPGHKDARAYTIAVDASYGDGKTFFLRRLAKQLALTHPVAFVDAWADDLADEPLTALAATLKTALHPLLGDPKIRSRWSNFISKTGRVAKIASAGLLRRGLGMLLTATAVDAAEEVLTSVSESVVEAIDEGLADVSSGLVDDASKGARTRPEDLMATRVREFEEGQRAVEEMKESLGAIVAALPAGELEAPVCIIIDELDRCRPTYAIKVLEEIKHLFDVPGLVFIFGLHGDQLAHSVSGAYGPGFDGASYLRRFLNRRYALAQPALEPLVEELWRRFQVEEGRFRYPKIVERGGSNVIAAPPQKIVAALMDSSGLTARDAFEVIDVLQTSAVLSEPRPLDLVYLLAHIAAYIKKTSLERIAENLRPPSWELVTPNYEGKFETRNIPSYIVEFRRAVDLSTSDLNREYNNMTSSYIIGQAFDLRQQRSGVQIGLPENYEQLIATVSRFKSTTTAAQ